MAAFGARVRVKDLDRATKKSLSWSAPATRITTTTSILTSSPIGQGLLGKKRGDVVEIQVPMGKLRFEVLDITLSVTNGEVRAKPTGCNPWASAAESRMMM